MEVAITIDDNRLKSNRNINQTLIFTKMSSFYIFLDFTQSHSEILGDDDGFVQLTPRRYKSDKPFNITGIDKIHLKSDCVNGSIVNGTQEPILHSFVLDKPPDQQYYKETRNRLFKKIKKSVLSQITIYLEID